MIHKGCTEIHGFKFPYDASDVESLYITYKQNGETIVEKTLDDCTFDDGVVSVNLSQEDTLKFHDDEIVKVQIRVKFTNGKATKSNIMETYTDNILKDGVI